MAMHLSGSTGFQPQVGSSLGTSLGSVFGKTQSTEPPANPQANAPSTPTNQSQTTSSQAPTSSAPQNQATTQSQTSYQPSQPQPTSDGRPAVFAQMPQGLSLPEGTTLFAQVAGQDESGGYLLQMGENLVPAQTESPLQVGQLVQLQVQTNQGGQAQMQLVDPSFSQMQAGDLAENLADLNLPVSDSSVALAQAMVEHGLPLTAESFSTMLSQTAMPAGPGGTQLPVDARVSAVVFLQQNQIEMSEQNVTLLGNFFAENPNLGVQMLAVNGALQKLQKSLDKESFEALGELPSILGGEEAEGVGAPGQPTQPATPPKLYNMAKQVGIENNWSNFYGGDDDKPDIAAALRELRGQYSEDGECGELMSLLKGIEQNLDAQKLINTARPPQDIGFYYLQIPLSFFTGNGAQVWVRYERRDNGRRDVDPNDSRLEFLVSTENLGDLQFVLDLQDGTVNVEVNSEYDDVREFVQSFLPDLGERIKQLGWQVSRAQMGRDTQPVSREFVERTEFASVQNCNVQA